MATQQGCLENFRLESLGLQQGPEPRVLHGFRDPSFIHPNAQGHARIVSALRPMLDIQTLRNARLESEEL